MTPNKAKGAPEKRALRKANNKKGPQDIGAPDFGQAPALHAFLCGFFRNVLPSVFNTLPNNGANQQTGLEQPGKQEKQTKEEQTQ